MQIHTLVCTGKSITLDLVTSVTEAKKIILSTILSYWSLRKILC